MGPCHVTAWVLPRDMLKCTFNFHIDPHVKVEGRRENVVEAKKKILEVLETKVSVLARSMMSYVCDDTSFSTVFLSSYVSLNKHVSFGAPSR